MFTKWQQIEDWIRDHRFNHWVFYKNNPDSKADGERTNDKIVDSNFYTGEPLEEKLQLTRKYLEQWGTRAYGIAFQSEKANTGGSYCVVCIEDRAVPAAPAAPVAGSLGSIDVEELKAQVREQVRAEYERAEYERKRKEFDAERKEFERDKNSAVGLMVGYLKPVIAALGQKRVAGVDSDNDIHAARIHPIDEQPVVEEADDQEESIFTDEEADRVYALLERLKRVEPQYLKLLESVVSMAEANDSTYQMARGFLLKD